MIGYPKQRVYNPAPSGGGGGSGTVLLVGDWDASGNTIPTGVAIKKGYLYNISAEGEVDGVPLYVGQSIMAKQNNPTLIAHYRIFS